MNVEDVLIELMSGDDLIEGYQFCVFRPYVKNDVEDYPLVLLMPDSTFWVSRERAFKNFLNHLTCRHVINDETSLGLTSLVRLVGGGKRHRPLIDFNCGKSSEDLMNLYEDLKYLRCLDGYLLNSSLFL